MPIPSSTSKKGQIIRYLQAANGWVPAERLVRIFGAQITVRSYLLEFYYKGWIDVAGSTRDRRVRWIKEEE